MPTPSFDDLLSKARQLGERRASDRTNTLLAQGLSGAVTGILGTNVAPKETYMGAINQAGDLSALPAPVITGGNIGDYLMRRVMGTPETPVLASGMLPLNRDEMTTFAFKKSLEDAKDNRAIRLMNARLETSKDLAKYKAALATSSLDAPADPLLVERAYGDAGIDSTGKPALSWRGLNALVKMRALDQQDFWKNIFAETMLGKDFMGQVDPATKEAVSDKIKSRGTKTKTVKEAFTPASSEKIRVREKSSGQTGTIDAAEFDPALYERM